MARALIVGCGCRGRELGAALVERGWVVRGTSRTPAGAAAIEAAGLEPAIADPDRIATLLDAIEGVALIYWLLAEARGERECLTDLHGPRFARLLEEIVDTPVRGVVYEVNATLDPELATGAFETLRAAGERWRIPYEVVDAERASAEWLEGMLASAGELVG